MNEDYYLPTAGGIMNFNLETESMDDKESIRGGQR
jgi:hypothetical protein